MHRLALSGGLLGAWAGTHWKPTVTMKFKTLWKLAVKAETLWRSGTHVKPAEVTMLEALWSLAVKSKTGIL